jgi:hypothetical protein
MTQTMNEAPYVAISGAKHPVVYQPVLWIQPSYFYTIGKYSNFSFA